jgi:hypothetical protein
MRKLQKHCPQSIGIPEVMKKLAEAAAKNRRRKINPKTQKSCPKHFPGSSVFIMRKLE